jgi:hypothetical protein
MHEARIEHATGTVDNPLSDQQLVVKFTGNAEPVLGRERARALADMIWRLDTLGDIGELVRASA